MSRYLKLLLMGLLWVSSAQAELVKQTIDYSVGETEMVGYLVYDDATTASRPGVLVVHEWWGLNEFAQKKTEELAELGYVAFALDMYGGGKDTEHPETAGEWASQVRGTPLMRERARAGLELLRAHELTDPGKLAAIGFCFGGTTVLELAYSGADLQGIVSFHGGLSVPAEDDQIKAGILVCHGAADPMVTDATIDEFQRALAEKEADWMMIYYGGAQHSFTNPGADERGIDGLGYDPKADERSWDHMKLFFDEIFSE